MGIGDDLLQLSFIKVLWWTMLRTMLRAKLKDLSEAEAVVMQEQPRRVGDADNDATHHEALDYLVVRAMGLTPSEPARGSVALLRAHDYENGRRGKLGSSVAKDDVAAFMLQEAITPTLSRTVVTVGPGEAPVPAAATTATTTTTTTTTSTAAAATTTAGAAAAL